MGEPRLERGLRRAVWPSRRALLTAVPKSVSPDGSPTARSQDGELLPGVEFRELWNIGESVDNIVTCVDPMTLGTSEQTSYTHNLILCETPAEPGSTGPGGAAKKPTPFRPKPPVSDHTVITAITSSSDSSDDDTAPAAKTLINLPGGSRPSRSIISAWPLYTRSAGGFSLQLLRPDIWHERAFMGYWNSSIKPSHPFARDVKTLHTGQAYRAALIREHRRLLRFSTYRHENGVGSPRGRRQSKEEQEDGTYRVGNGALPLVMQVDGAWDCIASVINKDLPGLLSSHSFAEDGEEVAPKQPVPPPPDFGGSNFGAVPKGGQAIESSSRSSSYDDLMSMF